MKKTDREKLQAFILAELALGGELAAGYGQGPGTRNLRTHDNVMIELPSTAAARGLINDFNVIKKSCGAGYVINPKATFDAKQAGKRQVFYIAGRGYMENYEYGVAREQVDMITESLRVVTFFGSFGACGVGNLKPVTSITAATKQIEDNIKKTIKGAKEDHIKALGELHLRLQRAKDGDIHLDALIDNE